MITTTARLAGACPQCGAPFVVGATIAKPEAKNRAGGRAYAASGCWYCPACAEALQALHDLGAMGGAPFLTAADKAAFDARPDVVAARAVLAARRRA